MPKLSQRYLDNFEYINRVMLCYDDKALLIYINNDCATYYVYNKEKAAWLKDDNKIILSRKKLLEELEYIELENWLDIKHIVNDVNFKLIIEFNNNIDTIVVNNYGTYDKDFNNLVNLFLYQNTGIFAKFNYKYLYLKSIVLTMPLTILFAIPILFAILTKKNNKLSNLYLKLLNKLLKTLNV